MLQRQVTLARRVWLLGGLGLAAALALAGLSWLMLAAPAREQMAAPEAMRTATAPFQAEDMRSRLLADPASAEPATGINSAGLLAWASGLALSLSAAAFLFLKREPAPTQRSFGLLRQRWLRPMV